MDLSFSQSMERLRRCGGTHRFPDAASARSQGGALWPYWAPKFPIDLTPGKSCFAIGSCFARNIEEALEPLGLIVPGRTFFDPEAESAGRRSNGYLNEYNPGSTAQRIHLALAGQPLPEAAVVAVDQGFVDLTGPVGTPAPLSLVRQRRADSFRVYRHLPDADLVIVTLGLVEAWQDSETGLWLNQMPPPSLSRTQPERYRFRRLGVAETLDLLGGAMTALARAGKQVVLTVSPVPLITSFTGQDAVCANEYSKSVLRSVAEELSAMENVVYFPSYEIVRSMGIAAFEEDGVHVRDDVVRQVTARLVAACGPDAPGPKA